MGVHTAGPQVTRYRGHGLLTGHLGVVSEVLLATCSADLILPQQHDLMDQSLSITVFSVGC